MIARSAAEVKARVQKDSSWNGVNTTEGRKGAILGALNKHLGGDQHRKIVLGWLFDKPGSISSNTLTDGQWVGLTFWISFSKDEHTNEWHVCEEFPIEASRVLTETLKHFGQLTLPEIEGELPDTHIQTAVADLGATVAVVTDELIESVVTGGVEPPDTEGQPNSVKVHTAETSPEIVPDDASANSVKVPRIKKKKEKRFSF